MFFGRGIDVLTKISFYFFKGIIMFYVCYTYTREAYRILIDKIVKVVLTEKSAVN